MSSALPLFVLGNIYFVTNASLTAPNGFNLVPNAVQELTANLSEPHTRVATIRRDDYTYTPGIGAHKVHGLATNWNDARSICRKEGGDLAIINSKAEANVILQLFEKSKPHHGSQHSNYALIGIHDIFVEGQFETVDGKRLSETGYDEWDEGEPNQSGEEDCGTINSHNGKLNDSSCTDFYVFVCELPDLADAVNVDTLKCSLKLFDKLSAGPVTVNLKNYSRPRLEIPGFVYV